ncbi:MAG TPA: hypothetical protein VN879_15965 [Candidatus Acidoferrales bacterium]|nr:hypothetical protein [Candidatus Acidoferrales bacterium]
MTASVKRLNEQLSEAHAALREIARAIDEGTDLAYVRRVAAIALAAEETGANQ